MKEYPILFSTPMVQAILEGRKTQTRRVVKTTEKGWDAQKMEFVKSENINESFFENKHASPSLIKELTGFHAFFKEPDNGWKLGIKCPYGQPGDRLWVRETTIRNSNSNTYWPVADGYVKTADYEKTVPSIHMPKAAARIWLEIEEIKVEKLQNITDEDAKAEGVNPSDKNITAEQRWFNYSNPSNAQGWSHKAGFETLWQKINGPASWDANLWVWVIKFKVISTTGKPASRIK